MLSATVVTLLISLVTSLVLGNGKGSIQFGWNSFFFLTKNAGLRDRGIYLSSLHLNETPIFKKHGRGVTQMEDIPNSYAVASFHKIWHDMALLNIRTSHFFILYNWWKNMLAETLDYLVCIVVVRKRSSAFRLTMIIIETLWVLIWSFACKWVMDACTNCAWHCL